MKSKNANVDTSRLYEDKVYQRIEMEKDMNKVVRVQLLPMDMEGLEFKDFQKILWDLQYETRQIANRAVQLCWEVNSFESAYLKAYGAYPDKDFKKETLDGRSQAGYVYAVVSKEFEKLNTACLATITQNVCGKFQKEKVEYLKGTKSIPSYKKGMPIDLHNKTIKIGCTNNKWECRLSLLSNAYKKELGLKSGQLPFKMIVKDKSSRIILERCFDGVYKIAGSKLIYKNSRWYLNLGYGYNAEDMGTIRQLPKENICGVFIGEFNAVYATNNVNKRRLIFEGGEVEQFRAQVEHRRRQILKSCTACGEGRKGHGYYTRVKPVDILSNKISNFRDTVNHRYSKAIVKFAIDNECGTISMESLKDVSEKDKTLKNWSYFDLQNKIEYKAGEAGIQVLKPSNSDIKFCCSECGSLKKTIAPQGKFLCSECDTEMDHDYNASRNLINSADPIQTKK